MKKRYRRVYATQYLLVGASLIAIIGLGFLSSVVMKQVPFEDHFAIPWAAGRSWLLDGTDPYSEDIARIARNALANSSYQAQLPESSGFTEPILNLFFYLPFSLIPYEISRAIWVTVLVIGVGLIGYFSLKLSGWETSWPEKVIAIALTVAWFPGVKSILTGQLSPLVILLLLAGIYAILKGKDTAAGFMLALTVGSFPTSALILFLVMIWVISRRRWSILTAFFAGLAFLLIISLLLLPSWPLEWLGVVLDVYSGWTWVRTPLMDVAASLPGIEYYLSIALHVGFGIYLIVLWGPLLGKAGREFTWKVLALFVLALLFHVQSSIYYLLMVIPALFLVFRFWSERWRVVGRILSWLVMAGIVAGSWQMAASSSLFTGDERMTLLVAGLPLLAMGGMVWIRWWALRIPRLPFEKV